MARKIFYLLVALATFTLGTFFVLNQQKEVSIQKETAEILVLPVDSDSEIAPDYGSLSGSREILLEIQPALIDFDDLKVRNIGLDSKEYLLRKTFGKALVTDETMDSYDKTVWFKTLSYEGIKFGLLSVENRRNYEIYEVEITSPNWVTKSGIKIGDDIKDISKKFDTSNYQETQSSEIISLDFKNTDGAATFDFQNNKLVRIYWCYNFVLH